MTTDKNKDAFEQKGLTKAKDLTTDQLKALQHLAANVMDMNDMPYPEAALMLAKAGIPLLQGKPNTKEPIGKWNKATHDVRVITSRWKFKPNANIAILTGYPFFVLDIDMKGDDNGMADLYALIPEWKGMTIQEIFPNAPIARTPSGGYHVYFLCNEGLGTHNKKGAGLGENKPGIGGIDTRATGGIIIAAPSYYKHWEDIKYKNGEHKGKVKPEFFGQRR